MTGEPSAATEVLVNAGLLDTRVALVESDRLVELHLHGPWTGVEDTLLGGLFLGRVAKIVKGVNGAFVDIGVAQQGFLSARDAQCLASHDDARVRVPINECVSEGELLMLQTKSDSQGDKGPRMSGELSLPGRYVVLTPGAPEIVVSRRLADASERDRLQDLFTRCQQDWSLEDGFIVRTAAAGLPDDALVREAELLVKTWEDLDARSQKIDTPQRLDAPLSVCERILLDCVPAAATQMWVDDGSVCETLSRLADERFPDIAGKIALFDEDGDLFEARDVEAEIDVALGTRVPLPSGGSIVIEPTQALIAVDVNAGAAASGGGAQNVALRTNLEAAEEIARQLRLRDLGGLVAIDFLRMTRPPDRARVIDAMHEAMAGDPASHRVGGVSPFGLMEVTRRRQRVPLADRLMEATGAPARRPTLEAVAAALLRRIERTARTTTGGSLTAVVSPELATWLAGPGDGALAGLKERLGGRLALDVEDGRERDAFEVRSDVGS